jgi:hypothetical protein
VTRSPPPCRISTINGKSTSERDKALRGLDRQWPRLSPHKDVRMPAVLGAEGT